MNKTKDFHGIKSLIRGAEGILELCILALIYYFVWRNGYDASLFPLYLGKGK